MAFAQNDNDWSADDEEAHKAHFSLVLGLVSKLTWLTPLLGIPTSLTGVVYGLRGIRAQGHGNALAGLLLSIFVLGLSLQHVTTKVDVESTRGPIVP